MNKESRPIEIRWPKIPWDRFFLLLSGVCAVAILIWLMKYCQYGFDFTDEGYYLVWTSNPFDYGWSVTQFGYLYHPLFQALNGSIPAFRRVNLILTFALTLLLIYLLISKYSEDQAFGKFQKLFFAAGFSTASLLYLDSWLPTPSYNSLALQALLVTAIGLMLGEINSLKTHFSASFVIGVGGWLAFMAKPSTAIGLAVVMGIYLIWAREKPWRPILFASGVSFSLVIFCAYIIDGSILKFLMRLKLGAELSALAGAGYSLAHMIRLDRFHMSLSGGLFFTTLVAVSFLAVFLGDSESPWKKTGGRFILISFVGLIFLIIMNNAPIPLSLDRFHGIMLWAIPFSVALLAGVRYGRRFFSVFNKFDWAIVSLFLVFPHVFAIGTNGNYWIKGGTSGVFWLMTGLVLAGAVARKEKNWRQFLPLVLATEVVVVVLLHLGVEQPYRQSQALWLNLDHVEVGAHGSELILSKSFAQYICKIKVAAQRAGFVPKTPMVDLTGQSPGVLYLLGAKSMGYPWLAGGYPGSFDVARRALARMSCADLASSWLLTEPHGPRELSTNLLATFGGDIDSHYELATEWETAEGAGGYSERRVQRLFKPVRSKNLAQHVCEETRTVGKIY